MLRPMELCIADHGESTGGEQAAEIAIALLADVAELISAAARILLRDEPDPGREIASRSKRLGGTNARDQSSRQRGADTRDGVKPLARLIRSVPCHDMAIEGQDLGFQRQQLSPKRCDAGPGYLGIVVCWRMNGCRVRCRLKQLCCSGDLVGTKRMFGLVTASQIASASAASFFCRLT
jgi:hypothetical protein